MALYSISTNGKLDPHLSQEWLITNGIGGFSSSSAVGCNTRRYHGLLCAALSPPVGRMVTLSRLGEMLLLDGKAEPMHEFSVCQFANAFHPQGWQYLRNVELGDTVRWSYNVDGVSIIKEIQMPWNQNAVGIRYRIDPGGRSAELRLAPFVAMRDFHALRRGSGGDFKTFAGASDVAVSSGDKTLFVSSDVGLFTEKPDWWFGHYYSVEAERGQDFLEDLYTPGYFSINAQSTAAVTIWASTEPLNNPNWNALLDERTAAIAKTVTEPVNPIMAEKPTALPSETIIRLSHAANDFIVARKSPDGKPGSTVIAGYPWFSDWGRDTMISLPGLLLCTGRFEQAKQVLSVFAQYVSQGMIPNRFDDYTNEPEYNTVDASLWFVHAAFEYLRQSGDSKSFEAVLRPACQEIVAGYKKGTRWGIAMDPADGLIQQGGGDSQLTWMDAKCGGIAFTPRAGKPVEINALWFNALKLLGDNSLADQVAESFRKAFYISPFRGCADVYDTGPVEGPRLNPPRRDTAIRPNQIFAVSLPNSPLLQAQQAAVVEVVRRELLTPMGLRTLDAANLGYKGRYTGPQMQRDGAYHNGTVWAWLLGPFVAAYLRVNNQSPEAVLQGKAWLAPLISGMADKACIGQISEIFDGDPPHRPVGCFAQAWSVAETLRVAQLLGL